eukprot:TRINITY_DN40971_c0_g1_i1.p1 TRINITY_DN40971_c0_g1~~TRINITY_DN40971_c0_g1_i1.p1  ORF type:complete len:161 (+),score=14.61 TRINITY_DN40971_c0_g1_i1:27-509(+)
MYDTSSVEFFVLRLTPHNSVLFFFFLLCRRPPRSTLSSSSAASDVYKRQAESIRHPVEVLQTTQVRADWSRRMHQMRTTHGWAVAAKEAMDSSVMLGSQRLGGLPTSNVLYHSYHGSLTDIDINDLYGRPEHNPLPVLAPRAHFEKQFHGEELTIKQVKL